MGQDLFPEEAEEGTGILPPGGDSSASVARPLVMSVPISLNYLLLHLTRPSCHELDLFPFMY